MVKPVPPKRPDPRAGQVWFIQREPKHPVLTAEIDEVTHKTVLLRWAPDGGIFVRADATALRYRKSELFFVERVGE